MAQSDRSKGRDPVYRRKPASTKEIQSPPQRTDRISEEKYEGSAEETAIAHRV